jgi:hypothetical protein
MRAGVALRAGANLRDFCELAPIAHHQMIIQPQHHSQYRLAISQPAHSWISGQLARAWGNEIFSTFQPFEQLCYAAEQHDVGFLQWETAPTLNQATGLPHTFDDLPEQIHFEIWRTGIFQLRAVCPYASLVVSLHFCNLCERFHSRPANRDQAEPSAFLKEQREYQQMLRTSLQRDPLLTEALESDVVAYHRDLIATWDYLSLELCRGRSGDFTVPHIPIWPKERAEIRVRKSDDLTNVWEVDPWPFKARAIAAVCEAKQINLRFDNADAMRVALQDAERFSLQFHLRSL